MARHKESRAPASAGGHRLPVAALPGRAGQRDARGRSLPGLGRGRRDHQGDRRQHRARCAVADTPALPLRRLVAAPPVAGAAQRLREDRRGLRPPVRVLHHPQAARPAAQPRSASRCVREARELVAGGTREINLVAQDLTTYGTDLPGAKAPDAPRLASLLRQLAAVDGLALDPPALRVSDRVHRRAARRDRARAARRQATSTCPSSTSTATSSRRCGAATASGRCATWSRASARACRAARCARRSSSATRARPTRRSSGCATSCARPSSTTSACSTSRARRARRRRCCRSACPRRTSTRAAASCCASSARSRRQAARAARPHAGGAGRGRVRRERIPARWAGTRARRPRIDGQVYLSLPPDAAMPAPGTMVDALVTHSAEYDLAAELVA